MAFLSIEMIWAKSKSPLSFASYGLVKLLGPFSDRRLKTGHRWVDKLNQGSLVWGQPGKGQITRYSLMSLFTVYGATFWPTDRWRIHESSKGTTLKEADRVWLRPFSNNTIKYQHIIFYSIFPPLVLHSSSIPILLLSVTNKNSQVW